MNKLTSILTRYFPLFSQLFRFGMVGIGASSVHFCTVVFLVQLCGFLPLIANIGGFLAGFQISYWGHRLWTFSDTITIHLNAVSRLLFLQTIIFAANESLFYIFLSYHWPYQLALLMVLTILPIFSFVFSKLWVFA